MGYYRNWLDGRGGTLEDAATEEPKRRNVTRAILHGSTLSRVSRPTRACRCRDGHQAGAYAMARDAAGGVGGLRTTLMR
jgi:hypothetical protein